MNPQQIPSLGSPRRTKKPHGYWLPRALIKRVASHLLGNYSGDPHTPLMQLWYSRPGDGKTFGVCGILRGLRVRIVPFGAAGFESDLAGAPARLLLDHYQDAQQSLVECSDLPVASALVIHDIDTGLGHPGGIVTRTINSQHLNLALLELCDRYVSHGRQRQRRAPILLTANRPDFLPEALVRAGRAEVVPWEYDWSDRIEVVFRLHPHLGRDGAESLLTRFPEEPIGFFSTLQRIVVVRRRFQSLNVEGLRKLVNKSLTSQWQFPTVEPTLADLIAAGEQVQSERRCLRPEVEVAA